ncbi:MAG TPA: guanylate kinase [Gemmatimonadales bacterium]
MKPFLLVLSSPSGGGKTSIARRLLEDRQDLGYSVSATTRPMRERERNGIDYHFLTREDFVRRREAGEFLEWNMHFGHLYGTLRTEIEQILARGQNAVLDIEIEGARQIRANFPNALHLFVVPPSAGVLIDRLIGRNTEAPAAVRERIARAGDELAAVGEYDYAILNDNLAHAVAQVQAILDAESLRVERQEALPELIERLRRDIAATAEKI